MAAVCTLEVADCCRK